MRLTVNGELREVQAGTVESMVKELGLDNKLIVVEIDGQIIEKQDWSDAALREGMKVEIVHCVGGG